MSLLLDALKKAAKDKQAKAGDEEGRGEKADQAVNSDDAEELDALEFTLDENQTAQSEQKDGSGDMDDEDETDVRQGDEDDDQALELEGDSSASPGTVSDDALQLLIYKANREHRRKKKLILSGLATSFLVVLIAGAWYFYTGMIQDVESLERKHKIAMRTVHEHEVNVRTPVPQISDVKKDVEQNTVQVKQTPPVKADSRNTDRKNTGNRVAARPAAQQARPIEINRGSRQSPVSTWLNQGYVAYKQGDYARAREAYSQVLDREPNNRDALLGLGAIALKQNDVTRAKFAYQRLLKLDPNDPVANAALANMDVMARGGMNESKIKFLLQQQPNAPHLHYALGNIYAKNNRWPEAQRSYFSAWQGDSANADYAFNLAVSLDRIGKFKQAKHFYQSCLVLARGQNISFSVSAVEQRLNQLAGAGKS